MVKKATTKAMSKTAKSVSKATTSKAAPKTASKASPKIATTKGTTKAKPKTTSKVIPKTSGVKVTSSMTPPHITGGILPRRPEFEAQVDLGLRIEDLELDEDAVESLPLWLRSESDRITMTVLIDEVEVAIGGGSGFNSKPSVLVSGDKFGRRRARKGFTKEEWKEFTETTTAYVSFIFDEDKAGTVSTRHRIKRRRTLAVKVYVSPALLAGMVAQVRGTDQLFVKMSTYKLGDDIEVRNATLMSVNTARQVGEL